MRPKSIMAAASFYHNPVFVRYYFTVLWRGTPFSFSPNRPEKELPACQCLILLYNFWIPEPLETYLLKCCDAVAHLSRIIYPQSLGQGRDCQLWDTRVIRYIHNSLSTAVDHILYICRSSAKYSFDLVYGQPRPYKKTRTRAWCIMGAQFSHKSWNHDTREPPTRLDKTECNIPFFLPSI